MSLKNLHIESTEEYHELYSRSNLHIDASVGYFFCIDNVIENLRKNGERPKVVFLYREPNARAISLFNELRKKELTDSSNFMDDISKRKEDGFWWEYYYDNVLYYDNFVKIKSYFNQILSVNYDYFSRNQKEVLKSILDYLEVNDSQLDLLDLSPVNSSGDAIFRSKFKRLGKVERIVPKPVKIAIKRTLGHILYSLQTVKDTNLSQYLAKSVSQYEAFRNYINHEDMLCLKNL